MNPKIGLKKTQLPNRCSCCPYGYHIDVDFVQYCNALLSTLYSKKCYNSRPLQGLKHAYTSSGSSNSNQNFVSSSCDLPDTSFNLNCDSKNYKKFNKLSPLNMHTSYHTSTVKSTTPSVVSGSITSLSDELSDSALDDALAHFEEVFKNSDKSNSLIKSRLNEDVSFNSYLNNNLESQSSSPAPSANSSLQNNLNKALLSQVRDQLVISLEKMKELESQVKDIPILKQKLLALKKEKKQLMEKLEDDQNSLNDLALNKRVQKLEKSGLITPPITRRKFLYKSESERDDDSIKITMAANDNQDSISCKNIRLENLANFNDLSIKPKVKSTKLIKKRDAKSGPDNQLWIDSQSTVREDLTKTKKSNRDNLKIHFIKQLSISPKSNRSLRNTKSVGITTHTVPPLPRKNTSTATDLKIEDCVNIKDIESRKPLSLSRGTDPMLKDSKDAVIQAIPKVAHSLVATDLFEKRDFGITFNYRKDLNISPIHKKSQTDHVLNYHRGIQVSEKCTNCESKKTETVGVGSDFGDITDTCGNSVRPINSSLISSSLNSRANSFQEIKLCDKCKDTISVKDGVKDKTPSPTISSKIPRLTTPVSHSVKLNVSNNIIIEEGNNDEFLVYPNPNPQTNITSRKQQSSYSSMMTPRVDLEGIRLLDEACKITESDSEVSLSSDGTFILESASKLDEK